MGDNQEPSCSTSPPKVRVHTKVRGKLPTPPPDPTTPTSPNEHEDVFIAANALDYIKSLQKTMFTSVIATEDAFDHLDKLYKLMEQMLDLRQQNARLLNRIRDLDHLKNLETMHHQANILKNVADFDDDSVFAENLLDSMLSETKKDFKHKPWTRSVIKRQRSTTSQQFNENDGIQSYLSAGSGLQKSNKVSKWTKVKAAFRWEKASPSVTGAKSQDSGIGGMTPINYEIARYLRVPSSDEAGNSPADSGAADGSTPGSLSSASSNDDLHRQGIRHDSQCSDDDYKYCPNKNVHHHHREKSARRLQHHYDEAANSNRSEDDRCECDVNSQRSSVRSNKRFTRPQAHIPNEVVERYQKALADDERANKHPNRKRVSKWVRVKTAFLNTAAETPVDEGTQLYQTPEERNEVQEEIQDNYKQLQKKLSLEFKGKLAEWDRLKASNSNSSPTSHTRIEGTTEEPLNPAFAKKIEEWEKLKNQSIKSPQIVREVDLPPDFKKKLDEWQKIKHTSTKDDLQSSVKSKKKLGEWPRWKSISGHREEHAYNENPPLSDDFIKKLEEWRRIKEPNRHAEYMEKTPSPSAHRKQLQTITPPSLSPKHDDNLQWFETELNKIEIERKRLEAERQKFLQREERLGKLRRTVLGNENKKDVLVHTPSGFYKFEGISKKFTQKICEWETSQGIGPEASTFALLTSTFTPNITVNLCEKGIEDQISRLHRSKSAESLAISHLNENVQCHKNHHQSSLSLNDMEELERQCLALSANSSYQNINESFENLDNDEPEAVIVEVEDVVEETASLLEEYLEEKHFPIYQRESQLNTCREQLVVVPDIQEATRTTNSQFALHLLDDVIQLSAKLKKCSSNPILTKEEEAKKDSETIEGLRPRMSEPPTKSNDTYYLLGLLTTKLKHLQELHSINTHNIFCSFSKESLAQILPMAKDLQASFQSNDAHYAAKINDINERLTKLKQVFADFYNSEIASNHQKQIKSNIMTMVSCDNQEASLLDSNDEDKVDPEIVQKLIISTSANYLNHKETLTTPQEPASIFVNTTRRLFTPLEEAEGIHLEQHNAPGSPTTQKKLPKEISPGIRVMLAKYNQMITQQDQPKPVSGSSSPIAWRSPVSERRVKARRERYIEEIAKIKNGNSVKKSASSAVLNLSFTPDVDKGVLRSTSASIIQNRSHPLTVEINQTGVDRNNKLQRAKEEFMRSPKIVELPPEPSSAPPIPSNERMFATRTRYSQISIGSDSSYDSCALVKSASAGMINIDERNYRRLDTGVHQYGYLSLPRVVPKQKTSLFEGFSSIAAKFRKVKMKRTKKMSTVSALCRQSLVVDLATGSQEDINQEHVRHDSLTVPTPSSSEDTSPSSSRSGSWIRRSRLFKAL